MLLGLVLVVLELALVARMVLDWWGCWLPGGGLRRESRIGSFDASLATFVGRTVRVAPPGRAGAPYARRPGVAGCLIPAAAAQPLGRDLSGHSRHDPGQWGWPCAQNAQRDRAVPRLGRAAIPCRCGGTNARPGLDPGASPPRSAGMTLRSVADRPHWKGRFSSGLMEGMKRTRMETERAQRWSGSTHMAGTVASIVGRRL